MRSGPFINRLSEAYGVDEATVTKFARLLKEDGLMTTGIRGVNAPDMTPLDAARLTVALLATDKPSRAVEAVQRFGAMTANDSMIEGDRPSFFGANLSPAFEDVIAEIMGGSTKATWEFLSAEIRATDGICVIHHRAGAVIFDSSYPTPEERAAAQAAPQPFGIRVSRSINAVDMIPLQLIFVEGQTATEEGDD